MPFHLWELVLLIEELTEMFNNMADDSLLE